MNWVILLKKEYPNKKRLAILIKPGNFLVKSSELKVFVNDHLHKINNDFIMVTGDSDTEIRIDTNQKFKIKRFNQSYS